MKQTVVLFRCDHCGETINDGQLRVHFNNGKARKKSFDTCASCWEALLKQITENQQKFLHKEVTFAHNNQVKKKAS